MIKILIFLVALKAYAMTELYEHTAGGEAIRGSLTALSDAVNQGRGIKVKVINAAGHTELWAFDRVFVASNGHVFGEAPLRIANFTVTNGVQTFDIFSPQGIAVFGTNGKEIVKVNGQTYTNPLNMKWFGD